MHAEKMLIGRVINCQSQVDISGEYYCNCC